MSPSLSENHARLQALRMEYTRSGLLEEDTAALPVDQFARWMNEAVEAAVPDANAMTLSTATPEGTPSARVVLLKDFSAAGFTFFTNYRSRKGRELATNPQASLHFFWKELQRQVLIEGFVSEIENAVSREYFATRPRESQLGAWASAQSEVLEGGRQELEDRFAATAHHYEGKEVDCPPHWGGYLLVPFRFEFWQGRPSRLHDRIDFRYDDGQWRRARLSP